MDEMDVRYLAKSYLDKQGRRVPQFKENFSVREWFRSFMQRQRNFVDERLCQNIKKSRAAVSVEEIEKYVKNLNEILKDLPPSNIISYNETNLTDEPGKLICVFKCGVKYPECIVNSAKSATSIMFVANTVRDVISPYVLYKAEHLWDTWMVGGPKGTRYIRSKSDWFDMTCFRDWFFTLLLPYCKKLSSPKILIGDNLSSHISPDVLQACKDNSIRFVCLPPNSTHL